MIKYFIVLFIVILFGGCSADIDPSASNSISAILAVLGEYTLVILSLFLFYVLRFITILGGVVVSIGAIHMLDNSLLYNINPSYVLFTGFLLILLGLLQPNKTYTPKIIIANNSWKRKNTSNNKKDNKISEILIQIFSGLTVGIILNFCGIQ